MYAIVTSYYGESLDMKIVQENQMKNFCIEAFTKMFPEQNKERFGRYFDCDIEELIRVILSYAHNTQGWRVKYIIKGDNLVDMNL